MMDEATFKLRADEALEDLDQALGAAGEEFDFDCDLSDGALKVEFTKPAGKFVVSPQTPLRQLWVSAHAKSFKFDWDEARQTFVLPETGQTLKELMAEAVSRQVGRKVEL